MLRYSKIFRSRVSQLKLVKSKLLKIGRLSNEPVYIFDKEEVIRNYTRMKSSFTESGINPTLYYAVKSNPYIGVLKTVVEQGGYLDVSSQYEMLLAKKAKSKKVVYTGPGKTYEDFFVFSQLFPASTVIIESETELKNLALLGRKNSTVYSIGVRVQTSGQSYWEKFGITLESLDSFIIKAKSFKNVNLTGLHFHSSFNLDSKNITSSITKIKKYLNSNDNLKFIPRFIDIGGGIYPDNSLDAYYPWNEEQELFISNFTKVLKNIYSDNYKPRFIPETVDPSEKIIKDIALCFKKEFLNNKSDLWIEPGRYISHSSMHILLKVVDKKNDNSVIVNGGMNMIGWEKYQFNNYSPIFNLSRFNPNKEFQCTVYGSLCAPDDIWGFYIRGDSVEIGDILCLPFQGAYTYTLRQKFIKGETSVVDI